jgi:hypothetical protein
MAPVFTEMGRDSVGTGPFTENGGGNGIGLRTPSGLPDGGHVIDVHVQPLIGQRHDGNTADALGMSRRW